MAHKDGNLDAAQASLESLLDNRFDKFRDRSHYWIARARYAEACENYTGRRAPLLRRVLMPQPLLLVML